MIFNTTLYSFFALGYIIRFKSNHPQKKKKKKDLRAIKACAQQPLNRLLKNYIFKISTQK